MRRALAVVWIRRQERNGKHDLVVVEVSEGLGAGILITSVPADHILQLGPRKLVTAHWV